MSNVGRMCLLVFGGLVAAARATPPAVTSVDAIGMTVADIDRSVEYFSTVLKFERVSEVEVVGEGYERLDGVFGLRKRVVQMRLGEESLELTEYLAPRGRRVPEDSRANDGWFQHIAIIVSDMDRAYAHLRAHRVQHASSGPQTIPSWNAAAGGIRAFYFRDPDGHFLEILWFPPGKGAKRWHQPTDRLFLGIDHTAIVVADTQRSLGFYRDCLGLKVVGESENHGTEQEHLNLVFGARLRITTLAAARGPAIEFLEYLTPGDGRPFPLDTRASDLWHWHVRLSAGDLPAVFRAASDSQATAVSPGPVALTESELGFGAGLLIRDPDGHALLLTGK